MLAIHPSYDSRELLDLTEKNPVTTVLGDFSNKRVVVSCCDIQCFAGSCGCGRFFSVVSACSDDDDKDETFLLLPSATAFLIGAKSERFIIVSTFLLVLFTSEMP